MSTSIITRTYTVSDINLNVAEAGAGDALVLIHGWSNNWQGWTLLAQELAPFYHLYLIDLPGFGDSDRLPSYSIDNEADCVAAFIKNYVVKPKAIIGASLGTIIAANILKSHQQLTQNLILLGAIFKALSVKEAADVVTKILEFSENKELLLKLIEKTVKSPYAAYFVEFFLNAYKFDKELVDKYNLPGRRKITGKSYVELGVSASTFVMEQVLKDISIPTLLIYGEADKYVNTKDAITIVASFNNPQIYLEIIPQSGHNPGYEQPQKTARVIGEFLKK